MAYSSGVMQTAKLLYIADLDLCTGQYVLNVNLYLNALDRLVN